MLRRCAILICLIFALRALEAAGLSDGRARLEDPANLVRLTGKWKFITDDRPQLARPDYDDSRAPLINVESEWRLQGVDHRANAWFRLKVGVGEAFRGKDLGFIVPPVSAASEVYFNGKLVGHDGPPEQQGEPAVAYATFRVYQVPANLVNYAGENTLAIRVRQYQGIGGLFGNNYIFLGEYTIAYARYITLFFGVVVLAAAFCVIGLYHLILFFGRRVETEYFYFSLIAVSTGLHQLSMNGISYYVTTNRPLNQVFTMLVVCILPASLITFATRFFDVSSPRAEKFFKTGSLATTGILLAQFAVPQLYHVHIEYVLPLTMLLTVAALLFFLQLVYRSWRLKRHGALLIGLCFFVYMLTVTHDILAYLTLPVDYRLANIGFLFPVAGMATALAQKIQRMHHEKEIMQQHAIENLRKADILKDEFLANTSHELRTPLNGIIGLAESLVSGATGSLRENTIENLELIVTSGRRLSSLIDDILDFSRMKNNELRLHIEPVAAEPQISLVLQLSEPLLRGKPVRLEKDIPEDLPLLLADSARLQQVLHNLVGNAIKFTESGYVRVSARRHGEQQIAITVEDTGIGIAPADLGRIFNAFEQVDAADDRRFGGTGLGLTVTKRLVELQAGRIEATSELGKGSVFTIYFPVADHAAEARTRKEAETPRALTLVPLPAGDEGLVKELHAVGVPARGKVLVIDDELINLRILQNMLSLNGFECVTASSGAEGLALLESVADADMPDVVLLDVMMPKMTGYEVCERIREMYPVQALPVIMLTAKREEKDIVRGFKSGANDYLTKPFYQDELMSRVNTLHLLKAAVRRDRQLLSLEKELEIARQMQASLLPQKAILHARYDISWFIRPMFSVGGDLLDVHRSREGDLCFLIADVCGHGISAAMVTSMVKLTFLMSQRLMHSPAAMLRQMNETLALILGGTFVTAAVAYLSADGRYARFARAGHPPLLHYRAQSRELTRYQLAGKPMGDFPGNTEFTEQEIALAQGDVLMLHTDGVTEAESILGEAYVNELGPLLAAQGDRPAAEITDRLIGELDLHIAPKIEHSDDIACVVIKVK